ncbi:MAG: adenylate/guanylate cyclase domain-containing protein [Thiohalocapsa sp.]
MEPVQGAANPSILAQEAEGTKEGERRQVTVMFCDLVGSTFLASRLDPEDLREVIRAYQAVATASIERHAGYVARYMGDGILVYFGYPRAQEDDAERSVRAALEIIAAVPRLRSLPDLELDARVGIATGLAVVGDLIGKEMSREEAVVGRTPNLAARLQGLAKSGGVVISRETRQIVANLFDCRDLGGHDLKGFDEPIQAWSVVDEWNVDDRFEATRPSYGLVPLAAREADFQRLCAAWDQVRNGSGQVIHLRGAPGIGKSRLTHSLREHLVAEPHVVLRYYCGPRFQNSALFPIAEHMRLAAGLSNDDSPDSSLDKLEGLLSASSADDEARQIVPFLASLLSISPGDRYPPVAVTPERQKERVFDFLVSKLVSLARDQAVLMLFEDLHWIDPSSLELLERLIDRIADLPVLLLATSRPEFEPPWSASPLSETIELRHLDRDCSLTIVDSITGGRALPTPLLEQLLDKSGGVPLFIEEITKAVLESGLIREVAGRFELTGPLPGFAVPSSLQDSLMARLDRLGAAKKVAQVGAAIGRRFSLDLLGAVSDLPETELRPAIKRLVDSDLVECRQETEGASICVFKHALLQDAAHATMLRPNRQRLHKRIAVELENRLEQGTQTSPELLAHHFSAARIPQKAVPYLQQAGVLASSRAAHTEAIRHFRAAMDLLTELPRATRHQLELGIRLNLGLSLSAARGYAAPEVEDTYQRARELCHILGETVDLYPVIRGLCTFYIVRAQLPIALELAEQCVRLGDQSQDPVQLIEGYTALGYTRFFMGDAVLSRNALEHSLQFYRSHHGQRLQYPTSQDPAISDLALLALVAWMRGKDEESLRCIREALEVAHELKRPFDLAYARCFTAMFHNMRREPKAAAAHAAEAIDLAAQYGFDIWLAAGTLHAAIAQAALGQAAQATVVMEKTLEAWQAAGAGLNQSFFLAGLAEVHLGNQELEAALSAVDRAIDHAARHREHFYDAVLFRLRGQLRSESRGDLSDRGEADLLHAIDVARTQGARMFELEARASLHRWRIRSGRPDPHQQKLQSLYQDLVRDCASTVPIREVGMLLEQSVHPENDASVDSSSAV